MQIRATISLPKQTEKHLRELIEHYGENRSRFISRLIDEKYQDINKTKEEQK
jgi:metal-responsive CopG/Arc/MetJ family transcriptional regulator